MQGGGIRGKFMASAISPGTCISNPPPDLTSRLVHCHDRARHSNIGTSIQMTAKNVSQTPGPGNKSSRFVIGRNVPKANANRFGWDIYSGPGRTDLAAICDSGNTWPPSRLILITCRSQFRTTGRGGLARV